MAGQINKRKDRATQPMDHGRLRWAILCQFFLLCRYHDQGWCSIIVATYSQPHLINIADHWTNQRTNNPILYYADTFPSMIDLNHLPSAGYLYTFRNMEESLGQVDLDWTNSPIGGNTAQSIISLYLSSRSYCVSVRRKKWAAISPCEKKDLITVWCWTCA